MRRIIIGASRDIEYDIRNDFFARLEQLPLGYYQAAPHRRPDVARDQRPQRGAHDDRAGGHVFGEHRPRVRRGDRADAVDRRAADADRADPAAVRVDRRSATSAARSTSGSRRSRRSCPTSAPSSRKRCRASASSAPTGRRRTRSSGSARANDEYLRRNRVLIRLQGAFYPEHDAVPRPRLAARAVARQPRRDPRRRSRSASSWRSTATW